MVTIASMASLAANADIVAVKCATIEVFIKEKGFNSQLLICTIHL
jgi:hypothetical protein